MYQWLKHNNKKLKIVENTGKCIALEWEWFYKTQNLEALNVKRKKNGSIRIKRNFCVAKSIKPNYWGQIRKML